MKGVLVKFMVGKGLDMRMPAMSLNKIFWIQLLLSLIIGQQQAGTAWGEVRTWVDATGKFILSLIHI